uniref:NADH dehydrogenase subunit 6 n=1 Tax=Paragavialidium hainanense TaxID=3024219 RepID=UPI0023AAAB6D|nr:NADH dehydrogenase subunit 6 [Paragavialidium hainanense]WCF77147.1 NADH dehydrogenase subunit 6 [Paragavialidium hainanense]
MKMIMFTSMMLNFLFMNTKKPMNIIIIILMQAFLMTSIMSTQTQSPWFPYMLMIIFIGAMMVIFIYISSIMPNEKTPLNKMTLIIALMVTSMSMMIIFNDIYMMNEETLLTEKIPLIYNHNKSLNKMFDMQTYPIYITMMIYLFIALIAVSKMCNIEMGPLRKKN